MFIDYFLLAARNLRKRGIRSWLTMLGIFIGIAAVVSLISLGQGLETAITGQFATLSIDTLTITGADTGFSPPGSTAVRKLTEHDLDIIKSASGVKIVVPRLLRVARIEFNNQDDFSFVASIPEEQEQVDEIYSSLNLKAENGRLLKAGDKGVIVVGDDLMKNSNFGKSLRVGSRLKIQGREFELVGNLKRASTFQINSVIIMPEEDMKGIFEISDEIDLIVAKVEDQDEIEKVAAEIERKLRKDRNQKEGEEDFEVQTPVQALGTVQTIINVVNIVVAGIAAISLLVGGIGIANTMFTSVLERTKEIGVMKAIGAQNKNILTVFLSEAALLGIVGGLVGTLLGLALAFTAARAANAALGETIFIIALSPQLLLGAILFSLFIGVISGIIPAMQASRMNPVEALRK